MGLSDAERELVEMLAEEAAEVVQVCMKILRHGLESHHPNTPTIDNAELLEDEVEDFLCVLHQLRKRSVVVASLREDDAERRWLGKKVRWTRHQSS